MYLIMEYCCDGTIENLIENGVKKKKKKIIIKKIILKEKKLEKKKKLKLFILNKIL
jgi:hypothetical protein